ncbi:unnamed protein product [Schistosoma margrebowiei]|uniref:Uncharacterized protein n=1 Tax=Schistosoma margrebowiei TaxID=48269 RepID=A0AA85ALY6_9TREM|nr:unnamed protein product [Schistosoma margrebowiei]
MCCGKHTTLSLNGVGNERLNSACDYDSHTVCQIQAISFISHTPNPVNYSKPPFYSRNLTDRQIVFFTNTYHISIIYSLALPEVITLKYNSYD